MIRRRFFTWGGLLLMLPTMLFADAIDVQIDRSRQKFNLGFSNFAAENSAVDAATLQSYESVVKADLQFSQLFNLIGGSTVARRKEDALTWAPLGAEVVLWATINGHSDGRLEIKLHLNDAKSAKEVLSVSRSGTRAESRVQAHELANEVVKYFTGQPGIFTSKIVFVNDSTGRKELYLADYDGRNAHRLTNDNSIVILPRMSGAAHKIVFTSYMSGNPDLYIIGTDGTGRRKLSAKAGLNVSPSWAPDGKSLAITLSKDGPPNLYLIDTQGAIKQRLTDTQGADTAPSFSPDGNQIAFTSDRDGAPHIYIMNLDGSGLRRITTVSHCDSAAWSPDGQTILYVKGEGKNFDIYSIEVQTGIERRLTWGTGDSENPCWSPDGRFILFASTRRKKSELFIMSADGSDQRPLLVSKGQSFTPHWSN
jgi:TolB protein